MPLFHYSQSKSVRLAICIVVLFILFPALFRIIFAAKDEVSYSAGVGFSTCSDFYISDKSQLTRCTTTYDIALGNTGSTNQELIVVDLTSVPADSPLSWNVLDIVATKRRPIGPKISNHQLGDTIRIEIQNLEPNRLAEIRLSKQGIEFASKMENIGIAVQANGSTIQTNPRLTVSLRFLRNLGGIFGF